MRRAAVFLALAFAVPGALVTVACDESAAIKDVPPDAARGPIGTTTPPVLNPDAGPDAPTDCYLNPTTHIEIINACTTATKIAKSPVLVKLHPDGGLPPLP